MAESVRQQARNPSITLGLYQNTRHLLDKGAIWGYAALQMDNEAYQTGTPLFRAITTGESEQVRLLLAKGADANECYGEDEEPALLVAAIENREQICKQLIAAGADVNACDTRGYTPLMAAVCADSLNIVKMLLSAGADVNRSCAQSNATALHDAATGNHLEITRELLAAGAEVNAPENNEGNTVLMCAVQALSPEITELLLTAGADRDTRSSRGDTALELIRTELLYLWEPVKCARARRIEQLLTV